MITVRSMEVTRHDLDQVLDLYRRDGLNVSIERDNVANTQTVTVQRGAETLADFIYFANSGRAFYDDGLGPRYPLY